MGNWDVEKKESAVKLPSVKIEQNKKGLTEIRVDGKTLDRCYSASYEQSVDTIPVFRFEVYGTPYIDVASAGVIIVVNPDSIPTMIEAIDYTLDVEEIDPGLSWTAIKEILSNVVADAE